MVSKWIGKNLRDFRKKAGLNQADLAGQIGVHEITIGRWESGEREPRTSSMYRLCEVLGVTEVELLRGPRRDTWEVRVILEADDEWRDTTMDMRSEAANTFSVHISPTKIGIEIIGNVEDENQLDSLLAEARAKALDAMAMRSKYRN